MISKLFGAAGLVACLGVVYLFEGSSFGTGALRVLHWPAIVLTGLGPIALLLLASSFRTVMSTLWSALFASPERTVRQSEADGREMARLAERFYEGGFRVFEEAPAKRFGPTLSRVVTRLAERMPLPDVGELVRSEREKRRAELEAAIGLVGMAVRLSPSVGMLGTILGMVQLLASMQDPAQLGPHMSLALFTTFYGLFFSLAFWTPVHHRLERTLEAELKAFDRALQWVDVLTRRKSSEYFSEVASLGGRRKSAGTERERAA
jgi:chemotaxis protein MotA